jgi:hypothetical protein
VPEWIRELIRQRLRGWRAEHPGEEMDDDTWRRLVEAALQKADQIVRTQERCAICESPIGPDEASRLHRDGGFAHIGCSGLKA